jgi:hypothetical protein
MGHTMTSPHDQTQARYTQNPFRAENPQPQTIDITRPYEILAICPECGNQRNLPEDWQQIMAPTAPPDWDGRIRCQNGHWPKAMAMFPVRNVDGPQPDGTYLNHLVMDEDHRRAACTGKPWAGLPNNLPPGTRIRFCDACNHTARQWGHNPTPKPGHGDPLSGPETLNPKDA